MIDVLTEVNIEAPLTKVSEYVTNPDNAPHWYVNILTVEWKTPKPAGIGTKVAFVAQFLGRKLYYIYEFVEFIPGSKLEMHNKSSLGSNQPLFVFITLALRKCEFSGTINLFGRLKAS